MSALVYARLAAMGYLVALAIYALIVVDKRLRLHIGTLALYFIVSLVTQLLAEFVSHEAGREFFGYVGWLSTMLAGLGLTLLLRAQEREQSAKYGRRRNDHAN